MPTLTGYTPHASLAELLFPGQVAVSRLQTFTAYDRLSTALTVAQVYGVQRLCNHYAARLAPLPGPDSSRESNRRLAQITQYARQLAGSPSVINALSRSQLDEVGLTSRDIILFNQIIGFVASRRGRLPSCRRPRLSGALDPRYAPARGGTRGAVRPAAGSMAGRHCDPDLQYADDERQRRIAGWQSLPGLGELAPLLACDPQLFAPLEILIRQLSTMIPLARRSPYSGAHQWQPHLF